MRIRLFLLLLFFGYYNYTSFGQKYLLDVQTLTADDGLAHMHTFCSFKDSNGFLWIGTKYGLNRYDGYEFKLYTKEKNGLSRNQMIRRIEEDTEGKIWLFYLNPGVDYILTEIDVFDPITETVLSLEDYVGGHLPFKFDEVKFSKAKPSQKRLWIYDAKGQLFYYENKKFIKFFENNGKAIQTVAETENGLLIGSENELIQLDTNGQVLEKDLLPEPIHQIWKSDTSLFLLTQQMFTTNVDYTVWEKKKGATDFEIFLFEKDELLKKRFEGFMHRDQNGLWYLAGANNTDKLKDPRVLVFDPSGKELFDLDFYPSGLFIGNENLWLAGGAGLMKLKVSKNSFQNIYSSDRLLDTRGITEDEFGNIYFLSGPIFKKSQGSIEIEKLTTKSGAFGLIYKDERLYAGYHSNSIAGLNFDLKTRKESLNPAWEGYTPFFTYIETKNPDIYLFGNRKGLSYFDFKNSQGRVFDQYNEFEELKDYSVYHFHENKSGIWLATENGIYLMKRGKGIVQHFSTKTDDLPFNHIRHLSEPVEGGFWLATVGGGVVNWHPSLDENKASDYQQLTTTNGLSDNYVYAAYPDDYGSLWIPSDKGLMQMNRSTFEVKTYLTKDGLPHNEFNISSDYKAKDGKFYFGGLGGLISFDPIDFAENKALNTPINFTSFHLWEDGKEKMTNKTEVLQNGEAIVIRPEDKLFELKFALLDFDKPENHSYSYKIEGFDDRTHLIDENFLRITNLPYGNYQLKIKGQNRTKGWSNQELNIPIQVLKPFYLQWWFIGAMVLGSIGLAFAYVRQRERRLKAESERLEKEVKNRTQTIEQQKEELKELDKAKTKFFSNITHEFRTPLTLILGPSKQLFKNDKLSGYERKKLWGITKNAERLLSLINQMLDISKIEGGQMKIEISKGELVSFVKDLTEQFAPLAEKKDQKLNFNSSLTNWDTIFDKGKLNKILYNLISNALKFTGENGGVNVSLEKGRSNEILINVQDTGIGIRPEELDQVFNRFYQVDGTTTRANEGTGIGLSLVKELVDLLGGEIKVSSQLQKGTLFEIMLPELLLSGEYSLVDNDAVSTLLVPTSPDEVVDYSVKSEETIENSEKLDILVIEDNEGIHDYINSCIDNEKYNVVAAFDGEEGIQKALELIPDLIITDIMMPKKDGFEVTTAIRENITTSHIPLILLTAKSSLKSRLEGLERGADAFMTKPFSPQELLLRIDKLIEIRRLLHNRYQNGSELDPNQSFQKEDAFVERIKNFILENIENTELNGDVIGKHFGISRMHIYRKLKALTNQGVSEMIKDIRLNKAMELLQDKNNNFNVTEVSYKTGFSNVSYFSRLFKSTFGKAPSEV